MINERGECRPQMGRVQPIEKRFLWPMEFSTLRMCWLKYHSIKYKELRTSWNWEFVQYFTCSTISPTWERLYIVFPTYSLCKYCIWTTACAYSTYVHITRTDLDNFLWFSLHIIQWNSLFQLIDCRDWMKTSIGYYLYIYCTVRLCSKLTWIRFWIVHFYRPHQKGFENLSFL